MSRLYDSLGNKRLRASKSKASRVKNAKTSYKAYANKLTKVKCLAKKLYFHSELENCKGDGRKIWDLLNSLLPSKKKKNNALKH